MKVLILEDDAPVGDTYALSLRRAGFEVSNYATFDDARAALRRDMPDALVTDIRVGEFNGLQLAILFRSMSPSGKIVVVTGHDDRVIKQEAELLGAIFITKPISLQNLADVLS